MKKRKVAIITGASAGLGRAIALEFAKNGYYLGLISRNEKRLKSLQNEIGKASIFCADVSSYHDLEKAAKKFESELGPIDVWINNAMCSVYSEVQKTPFEEFQRVTEVTYLGTVYGTKVALEHMKEGLIIQISSGLAYRGIALQAPYCAAKRAIVGFTEALNCELLYHKSSVKTTMIHMPALNTPHFSWVKNRMPRKRQPVPPIFQPEVAAKAVYYATTHYRRRWILGMSVKKAIVMNHFFPSLLDRILSKKSYTSQQYDGFDDPDRKNNLFETVDGSFGSRGSFDKRAKNFSLYFWISKHRLKLLLFILIIILGYFFV